MNLLRAQNLAHTFEYPLFNDVSLELNAGESIAIIGESGSGKSTLLHILSTLLEPDEGSITLLDQELYNIKDKALVAMRKDDLGMIFQSHYLFKGLSAYENLEVASILSDEAIDQNLLERLDVTRVIEQKVTELSGGQQQRISIIRVLTKKPRIIFADEPTGNLDNTTAVTVMDLLDEYVKTQKAGMIFVTHNNDLAMRCQRVYELKDKTLVKVK